MKATLDHNRAARTGSGKPIKEQMAVRELKKELQAGAPFSYDDLFTYGTPDGHLR